jgi:hypothetical protein
MEKNLWKKGSFVFSVLAIVFIIAFLFRKCNSDYNKLKSNNKVTIVIPAKNREFKQVVPEQKVITIQKIVKGETTLVLDPKYRKKNDSLLKVIDNLIAENNELIKNFKGSNGNVRNSMYENAIKLKSFEKVFDDSLVNIKFNGIVRGDVKSISSSYTIKQQSVKVKETKFRFLTGLEVGSNIKTPELTYKLNLMGQNAKANIYEVSLQNVNNQNYIMAGFNYSLFTVKK